ncbi:class I SAM-dependent methyltransferase [Halobacteria archaeon AArc-dxtr1]|nr:class I SAM-dependent methyltransferase [Halobacteria archaeon AArc-dxtr1]
MSDRTAETERSDADLDAISHPWFAALYDAMVPMEWLLASHREYLSRDLSGRVLDLGAGTGSMWPYLTDAVEQADSEGRGIEVHAIEPDVHMRRRAERAAAKAGLSVDLRDARAESLPYPDDAFDAVLSGMVFCTVAQPDRALEEVARVLAPGGEFRFLEHVRADGWRGRGQRLANPLWKRAAGGCQLTRDTVGRFVGHESFGVVEIARVDVGVFPAAPFVRGRLRRLDDR